MAVTPNLFDGEGSNSNGSANGSSRGISLTNINGQSILPLTAGPATVSILVTGNFNGAKVTLLVYVDSQWVALEEAVWDTSRILSGLELHVGSAYRLSIDQAGPNTSIRAYAMY